MQLDEPRGWRKLQAMAQREEDPQKLAFILERMNRLLDRYERQASAKEPASRNRSSDHELGFIVDCWQIEA